MRTLQWTCRIIFILCLLGSGLVKAASRNRAEALRNARVWQQPEWINDDFDFSLDFDLSAGPALSAQEELLTQSPVVCKMAKKLSQKESNGDTRKFYCELESS